MANNSKLAMTTEAPSLTIRSANSVEEVTSLCWPLLKALGWNRATADCKTHFEVAQNGKNWLLAIPNTTNKPEGCVIALAYPNSTGWVAFFLMNAKLRRQGIGRQLWKEMELTFQRNGTKTIGLDGVQEQYATYHRRGFESVGKILLLEYHSSNRTIPTQSADPYETAELHHLKDVDPKKLAKLDLEHTGLDRSAYWTTAALLGRSDMFGFAILVPSTTRVTGFIFVRRCEKGHRFGPLYAESQLQAKQLLRRAMTEVSSSQSFVAEIFGNNAEGRRVFEELGWRYEGLWFHRMWLRGRVPLEQV